MQDNEPSYEWFATEDESESPDVGSLSDYISKHLQKRAKSEQSAPRPENRSAFLQPDSMPHPHYTAYPEHAGRVLHHLDSQLVNSHLERYLPTPSTRYHMTRERLEHELQEIYMELEQYRHLKGSEHEPKVQALEERANMLKRKIFDLDRKISSLNPFQSFYRNLQKLALPKSADNPPKKPLPDVWRFIPNPNREIRNEVQAINQELQSLQHILEEQLHDPCFSPQMMGRIVNQYDAELKRAEKLMEALRNRKSLGQRMGDTLQGWWKGLAHKSNPPA